MFHSSLLVRSHKFIRNDVKFGKFFIKVFAIGSCGCSGVNIYVCCSSYIGCNTGKILQYTSFGFFYTFQILFLLHSLSVYIQSWVQQDITTWLLALFLCNSAQGVGSKVLEALSPPGQLTIGNLEFKMTASHINTSHKHQMK